MLGKLIKYDLRSMSRVFVPLWIVAPVISLLFSMTIRGMVGRVGYAPMNRFWIQGNSILAVVMGILFVCVMVGLFAVTLMFIIQRFWKGLLKDEGYLMFTLPVETWKLIAAKGLSATLVTCISTVVGVFSCILLALASTDEVLWSFMWVWGNVTGELFRQGPRLWALIILFLLVALVSTMASICEVYASMALGQLFTGHRAAGAFASYIGISIALSVISSVIGMITGFFVPDSVLYVVNSDEFIFGIAFFLLSLLVSVIQLALFFVITERILSRKLNLE